MLGGSPPSSTQALPQKCFLNYIGPVAYLEFRVTRALGGLSGPTTSRGVWGNALQEILRILGVLRCVLVHSEANSNACMK